MKIQIEIEIEVFRSKGENYGTWIAYNKEYDISGYGADEEEAIEMFKDCVLQTLSVLKMKTI